jgi:hypothetical protein
MKRIFLLAAALLLSVSAASAATTQKWTAGWDNFSAPLNYTKSHVTWSVNSTSRKLTVTFKLVGANPSQLYQVALNFFCTTFPSTFGQFPNDQGGGACVSLTRQGVTATVAEVEVGVVTTDIHGNGVFTVVIGPVASGTYELEFFVRNGAGCDLINGGPCDTNHAEADFQSPGPFGTATTITIP